MANIESEYTLEQHEEVLGQYQAFSDAFYSVLEESQDLRDQLGTNGHIRALRLSDDREPLFELIYREYSDKIGWIQINHPSKGDKLVHVQTRLHGEEKGKVADSTQWEDSVYQDWGHIQADVELAAMSIVPASHEEGPREYRQAVLEFLTATLNEPGEWA